MNKLTAFIKVKRKKSDGQMNIDEYLYMSSEYLIKANFEA